MRVNKILIALFFLVSLSLMGCQNTPGNQSVISKNDGTADIGSIQSADEHHLPGATQEIDILESFFSTDNSVEFSMEIDETLSDTDMPVVEVTMYYPTGQEVKQIAQAIFGDADFYELEPRLSPTWSKADIQEKITRWSAYTSLDAITDLFGYEKESDVALVKLFIENYTRMYETAPAENPHVPCEWTYKNGAYYWYSEDEVSRINTSEFNNDIQASVLLDGVPYLFCISTHKGDQFQLCNISAYIYSGTSPDNIDEHIFKAQLLRTAAPTQAQIEAAAAKAEMILSEMGMGEWYISATDVQPQYFGNIAEYTVYVEALPLLNGTPVVGQDRVSTEDSYAYEWYPSKVIFQFSADGKLVSFDMKSPLVITDILVDNAAVLPLETLIEQAKTRLSLSDYYAYGLGSGVDNYRNAGIDVGCAVDIQTMEYSLIRVRDAEVYDKYYYIPGVAFRGDITYYDKGNDAVLNSYKDVTLLVLNGVTGAVVAFSAG